MQLEAVSVVLKFTRLQWAKLRSMTENEVLPVFKKRVDVDLLGKLLLSGLCCAVKRNCHLMFTSAIRPSLPAEKLTGNAIQVISKALSCIPKSLSLNLATTDNDESWLFEDPQPSAKQSESLEMDSEKFTKDLEKFFRSHEDGDILESDESDTDSDSRSSNSEEFEIDEETFKHFEEFENDIASLRTNEDDDALEQFMESMSAEGAQGVGPASMLFAAMSKGDSSRFNGL